MRRLVIVVFAALVVLAAGLGLRQGEPGLRAAAVGRPLPTGVTHVQGMVTPRSWPLSLVRQLARVRRTVRSVSAPAVSTQAGPCYVSGTACSLIPCVQFVAGVDGAPAVRAAPPAVVTPGPASAGRSRPACLKPSQAPRPASRLTAFGAGATPIGVQLPTVVAVR